MYLDMVLCVEEVGEVLPVVEVVQGVKCWKMWYRGSTAGGDDTGSLNGGGGGTGCLNSGQDGTGGKMLEETVYTEVLTVEEVVQGVKCWRRWYRGS